MGKFNSMAGGGKESEKSEDYLDKGSLFPNHSFRAQKLTNSRGRLRPGTPWSRRPEQ